MALFRNKEKKPLEPQYYVSATNMPTYNYKVYHMSAIETTIYFIIAFAAGAAVGYLFYGGIGKDEFGNPTLTTWILNVLISATVGIITGIAYIPIRAQQIVNKQKRKLNVQFRDMLESLNTSFGAGNNVVDSFASAYEDLKVQYDEGSFIVKEMEILLAGLANNIDIEDILYDFGVRSGNEDIAGFANVFKICYRKGGNIKQTVSSTHTILTDKMEVAEDIETIVTGSKNEQSIMIVMPVVLIGMIKMISADFAANFVTPIGLIATTVGVVLFVASYYVGRIVLNIKV